MGNGCSLMGAVVLVEGSRILDIRDRGIALPDGCEVAEFPGTTLLPGLIDTQCTSAVTVLYALERMPTFSDAHALDAMRTALAAGVDVASLRSACHRRHRRLAELNA